MCKMQDFEENILKRKISLVLYCLHGEGIF